MDVEASLYATMELTGTIAFACSGAMMGMKRKLDLLGIIVLALTTSFGGGIIRDILIGQIPPALFLDFSQAWVVCWISLTMFVIFKMRWNTYLPLASKTYDDLLNVIDAIGLGLFTVTGINKGISAGYEEYTLFCAFLGVMTGVGGGILRDILSGQTPIVLQKNIYVSASIAGAVSYLSFRSTLGDNNALIISSIIVFVIRILARYFDWNLPKAYME